MVAAIFFVDQLFMVLVKYCLYLLIFCNIVSFQILGRYIQMLAIIVDFISYQFHCIPRATMSFCVYALKVSFCLIVYMHSKFLTFFPLCCDSGLMTQAHGMTEISLSFGEGKQLRCTNVLFHSQISSYNISPLFTINRTEKSILIVTNGCYY